MATRDAHAEGGGPNAELGCERTPAVHHARFGKKDCGGEAALRRTPMMDASGLGASATAGSRQLGLTREGEPPASNLPQKPPPEADRDKSRCGAGGLPERGGPTRKLEPKQRARWMERVPTDTRVA